MTQINYRTFMETCGLDDKQVNIACKMFDSLQGKAIDGNGMGQILMCMIAFVIHSIRNGILTPDAEEIAVVELARRNTAALEKLRNMIDGGEECRGRDSEISEVIRILEDKDGY